MVHDFQLNATCRLENTFLFVHLPLSIKKKLMMKKKQRQKSDFEE